MIRYADTRDLAEIIKHDKHIAPHELENIVAAKRVLVIYQEDKFIGWLRYGLFWDNIPFINMLYILEEYRNRGNGTRLIAFFENETAKAGYDRVLTSTQSNERAQFFYRKLDYIDCGALLLPNEPSEILFLKDLAG